MRKLSRSLDLVFDPTLAFIRFPEDLLLRYAMITILFPYIQIAYVGPFARIWHGLSTTNMTAMLCRIFYHKHILS